MLINGHTQHNPLQHEAEWGQGSQSARYLRSLDTKSTAFHAFPRDLPVALLGDQDERPGIGDQPNRFPEQPHQMTASPTLHEKPRGLTDGFKKVCERWRLDVDDMARLLHLEDETWLSALILSGKIPPVTGDLKDRMALVIGISIGLGDLFDDSRVGELKWLNSSRSELGSLSPLNCMLRGNLVGIMDVVDLLDHARGLK
jgi:hypothetical protein